MSEQKPTTFFFSQKSHRLRSESSQTESCERPHGQTVEDRYPSDGAFFHTQDQTEKIRYVWARSVRFECFLKKSCFVHFPICFVHFPMWWAFWECSHGLNFEFSTLRFCTHSFWAPLLGSTNFQQDPTKKNFLNFSHPKTISRQENLGWGVFRIVKREFVRQL